MRFVLKPPDAAAFMMSARSFGNCDLSSALADLVDNNLKARARTVHILPSVNAGVELRAEFVEAEG